MTALFGVSNINGQTITGSFSYDTPLLNAPSPISNQYGNLWNTSDGSMQQYAVALSLTINGVQLGYLGGYFEALTVAYGCPASTNCGNWNLSSVAQSFQVLAETNTPTGVDAADFILFRTDNSANLTNPALNPLGPFNFS